MGNPGRRHPFFSFFFFEAGKGALPLPAMKDGQADMVAGAVAGAVARFVVAPLDVVKIRFQVGLPPPLALSLPSESSFFSSELY